jgi:exonuclease III
MRIVSWNMNKKGGDTWAFLLGTLQPDIALLQEAIPPKDMTEPYQLQWTPGLEKARWGSAVLSRFGEPKIDWEDQSRGAILVSHSTLPLLGTVSIASIHARVIDRRVIPALRETFDSLRKHLGDRFIVGGDLNTARAAALAWPTNGHGEFWEDVEAWGLREPLPLDGVERQSFWREWGQNKPPTIGNSLQDDHIFLDHETFRHVRRSVIWDTREVRGLSDHGPVVVDLALPGGAD